MHRILIRLYSILLKTKDEKLYDSKNKIAQIQSGLVCFMYYFCIQNPKNRQKLRQKIHFSQFTTATMLPRLVKEIHNFEFLTAADVEQITERILTDVIDSGPLEGTNLPRFLQILGSTRWISCLTINRNHIPNKRN